MKTKISPLQATVVAARVNDAYMTDCYGWKEWQKIGRYLASLGYDERQIEAILRSKYMRWASDHNNGVCTSAAFKRAWCSWDAKGSMTKAEAIADLVAGTFN